MPYMSAEDLTGKNVIVFANLKVRRRPRRISINTGATTALCFRLDVCAHTNLYTPPVIAKRTRRRVNSLEFHRMV